MEIKERVFVMSAVKYSFKNDDDVLVDGLTVNYLPSVNFDPIVDETGRKGLLPAKQSFPKDLFEKFVNCPGIYDVSYAMRVVGGKPMLSPVAVDFVSNCFLGEKKEK